MTSSVNVCFLTSISKLIPKTSRRSYWTGCKKLMELDKIKGDLQVRQHKGNHQQLLHLDLGQNKGVDQLDLDVLLQLLLQSQQDQVKNRDMDKFGVWYQKVAKKLQEHIEADAKAEEQTGENKEMTKQKEREERKEDHENECRVEMAD